MADDKRTHYKYKARAVGLDGCITLPIHQEIEPLAAVELADKGGFNTSRVEKFRLEHFVSFSAASSSVTGAYSDQHRDANGQQHADGAFFTVTTATVEGLDILGIVTAGKVVGRILSRASYVVPDTEEAKASEPSFLTTGSHFENLVIAGHPVTVKLHVGTFCDLDTLSKARTDGPRRLGSAFLKDDPANQPEDGGLIVCTLVDSIDTGGAPELHLRGRDSIFIEQFGTIQFGRVEIRRRERYLTMLEVTLGCGHEGSLKAASVGGNGSPGVP
jgi:hypothetical protein